MTTDLPARPRRGTGAGAASRQLRGRRAPAAQQLGGALGIATIGALFLARDGAAAFDAAAVAAAACFALCGLLCLALPRTALSERDAAELA
jgi:drug/metabolite transporter (DMT)-like permease